MKLTIYCHLPRLRSTHFVCVDCGPGWNQQKSVWTSITWRYIQLYCNFQNTDTFSKTSSISLNLKRLLGCSDFLKLSFWSAIFFEAGLWVSCYGRLGMNVYLTWINKWPLLTVFCTSCPSSLSMDITLLILLSSPTFTYALYPWQIFRRNTPRVIPQTGFYDPRSNGGSLLTVIWFFFYLFCWKQLRAYSLD